MYMCVTDFVSVSTFARIIDFGIVPTMWYILFGIILQGNKSSQLISFCQNRIGLKIMQIVKMSAC